MPGLKSFLLSLSYLKAVGRKIRSSPSCCAILSSPTITLRPLIARYTLVQSLQSLIILLVLLACSLPKYFITAQTLHKTVHQLPHSAILASRVAPIIPAKAVSLQRGEAPSRCLPFALSAQPHSSLLFSYHTRHQCLFDFGFAFWSFVL